MAGYCKDKCRKIKHKSGQGRAAGYMLFDSSNFCAVCSAYFPKDIHQLDIAGKHRCVCCNNLLRQYPHRSYNRRMYH